MRRRFGRFRHTSHANDARIADSVARDDCGLDGRAVSGVERQNGYLTDESVGIANPDVVCADRRRRARELQTGAGFAAIESALEAESRQREQ